MEIKKVVWAAMLAALSIVIDFTFNMIIPVQTMGTPYYAIPIIIAAIFLGPKYSIMIAFLGDLVTVLITPGVTFLPLFALASIMWGVIPGLLLKNNKKFINILLVVLITHLAVTSINSLALFVHYHKSVTGLMVDLPLRLGLIIPNTLIISMLVEAVLTPVDSRITFIDKAIN
ncbi:MAG: folate family ECF transporter S component [Acholeplasma sp.]|nr:folate family ECF transporter S component [Acholeplasma sp.]